MGEAKTAAQGAKRDANVKGEELKQEAGKAADSAQQNASQAADKAGAAVEDGKQKASGTAPELHCLRVFANLKLHLVPPVSCSSAALQEMHPVSLATHRKRGVTRRSECLDPL